MAILRPCVGVKNEIIRVVYDIKFWISGKLCLEYFNKGIGKLSFGVFLKILSASTENFCSGLRVASHLLFVHTPNRLKDVKDVEN